MNEAEESIRDRIDKDEGLRSKKRMLTIASLILLCIEFSGAKVEEANTFILKLSFDHQQGLVLLLMVSIVFLLIRYYNYAKPYHDELFKLWSERMLRNSFFIYQSPYDPEISGLIEELVPNGLDIQHMGYEENDYLTWSYQCRFLFIRKIQYNWRKGHDEDLTSVNVHKNVGALSYVKVLLLEFKYQVSSFFTHRENLDILAPYLLGVFAFGSFFYNEEIETLMKLFISHG